MLQVKLKETLASAQALLDKVDSTGGVMTAEQQAEFDGYSASIKSYKEQITAREQFAESSAFLKAGVRSIEPTNGSIIVGKTRIEDDPKRGFANIGEFAISVMGAMQPGSSILDNRLLPLAAPSGQMVNRGSGEAFEVPVDFRNAIWDKVAGNEMEYDLYNLFTPQPTSLSTVEITKDESTPWGSTGVKAYWGAESNQMTPSKLSTNAAFVQLHELYAFVTATDNLLSDLPRLSDRLTVQSGRAIRYAASSAIIGGDGIGKPLGFSKSGSLVTQAKETSQTAKTINIYNVANMHSRLIDDSNAFWLVGKDAYPQIQTLKYDNGMPAWSPNNQGFQFRPTGTLDGLPIYKSRHCETVGSAGDLYLVAPDGYLLLQKSGSPEYAESIHLFFDYNVKAFRWIFRFGGQPYMNSAVTPPKGSNTESYFVNLAARA